MLISNILSKPVIILLESLKLKFSNKFIIDHKFNKVRFLILCDQNQNYYLEPSKIFLLENDAIVIKKLKSLILEESFELTPSQYFVNLNSNIYTYLGDFVAKLCDIEIDEDFLIKDIVYEDKKKDITKILSSNKDLIIIDDITKNITFNFKRTFPKKEETLKTIPVKILLPKKTSNIKFLQGRIVTKDIFGYSGELIIKKDTIITEKNINDAKRNFKTQELLTNSKEIKFLH